MSGLTFNQNMKIGFSLGILQFIIYYARLDYLVTLGPFVAHHFVELPAFYYLGRGFYQYFRLPGWSNYKTVLASLLLYVANILLVTWGKPVTSLIAVSLVSFTYPTGLYHQWRIDRHSTIKVELLSECFFLCFFCPFSPFITI